MGLKGKHDGYSHKVTAKNVLGDVTAILCRNHIEAFQVLRSPSSVRTL